MLLKRTSKKLPKPSGELAEPIYVAPGANPTSDQTAEARKTALAIQFSRLETIATQAGLDTSSKAWELQLLVRLAEERYPGVRIVDPPKAGGRPPVWDYNSRQRLLTLVETYRKEHSNDKTNTNALNEIISKGTFKYRVKVGGTYVFKNHSLATLQVKVSQAKRERLRLNLVRANPQFAAFLSATYDW